MKNQNFVLGYQIPKGGKCVSIFLLLLINNMILLGMSEKTEPNYTNLIILKSFLVEPDSIPEDDSTFVIVEDTIFGYEDGLDSIFLIVTDTIPADSIESRFASANSFQSSNFPALTLV